MDRNDGQTVAALLVAAGRGTRAGGPIPKQWQEIGGRTIAQRTIDRLAVHPRIDLVCVVTHPDDTGRLEPRDGLILAEGGSTRRASVLAGLEALGERADMVLIHDIVRPFVPERIIDDVLDRIAPGRGAAPALPVTDALWTGADGQVTGFADRAGLWRAQTPQGFRTAEIRAAQLAYEGDAADDVEVAHAHGIDIAIVEGDERNFKITYPGDFERARKLAGEDEMRLPDIRLGNGYDVHRFGPGDHVTLCGVKIPHARGLQGHSDADVGLHAITDAIYGALAEGDIGQHFPPSDPQWKGAPSDIFLRHAVELSASRGYDIGNIDLTLVCERPKIGPHAGIMRETVSTIAGIEFGRISIKATTSERLGFTGREEGIAAIATVTLIGR